MVVFVYFYVAWLFSWYQSLMFSDCNLAYYWYFHAARFLDKNVNMIFCFLNENQCINGYHLPCTPGLKLTPDPCCAGLGWFFASCMLCWIYFKRHEDIFASFRDHFVYVPNQWETMLQYNVVFHWLGICTELSLIICQYWDCIGGWNPSSWKTETHLLYIFNVMYIDDLATQGAKVPTAMVLT